MPVGVFSAGVESAEIRTLVLRALEFALGVMLGTYTVVREDELEADVETLGITELENA